MFQFSTGSNLLGYFSNSNASGSVGGQDGQRVEEELGCILLPTIKTLGTHPKELPQKPQSRDGGCTDLLHVPCDCYEFQKCT